MLSFSGYCPVQEPSFSGIVLFRKYPFQGKNPRHCLVRKYFVIAFFLQAACQEEMIVIEMIALDHYIYIYCGIVVRNGA